MKNPENKKEQQPVKGREIEDLKELVKKTKIQNNVLRKIINNIKSSGPKTDKK